MTFAPTTNITTSVITSKTILAKIGFSTLWIFVAWTNSPELKAQITNYDQTSWIKKPIPLAIDLSGIQNTHPENTPAISQAIIKSISAWNQALGINLFVPYQISAQTSRYLGDGISGIYFTKEIGPGQSFSTQFGYADSSRASNGLFIETDILFNPYHTWKSYSGPLQYQPNGERVAEIGRVTLHELGHVMGISHPTSDSTETIMRSRMNDLDTLTALDLQDIEKAKKVITYRNLPTFDQKMIKRLKKRINLTRVKIQGESNPFITRNIFIQVRANGTTRTTRIRAKSNWQTRIELGSGKNSIKMFQRTALQNNRSFVRSIQIKKFNKIQIQNRKGKL